MNEQIIPSNYNGGGVSEEYNSPHTIYSIENNYSLSFKILPFSMYYYARDHIPNYNRITTYPNDLKHNPNTTGVTNFSHAFYGMSICKDTIRSIMNRFDWNDCTDMSYAFSGMGYAYPMNLTGPIPNIPNNVVNISHAFGECKYAGGAIGSIGNKVTDMSYVFYNCYNLTGPIPNIPNSVVNMSSSFYDCYNLTGPIPNIPNNVTNMSSSFLNCKNLTGSIPKISDNVINMSHAFTWCSGLTGSISKLPNNVTDISYVFYGCRTLIGSIPNIPNNVTDMSYAFYNCSNLKGSIPNIPDKVTNISHAFDGCLNLEFSNVYIHSNIITYAQYSFYNKRIYVHANTITYNTFYKAMGNTTYNAQLKCSLMTF